MKPKNLPPLSLEGDNQNTEMETYFKTLKETDYTGSFQRTAAWMRQQQYETTVEVSWLSALRLFLFGSALRAAYTVVALAFLVGACNYPVEVNEPVATVLRWEVDAQDKPALAAIQKLSWIRNGQLMVNEKNINGKTTLEYTCTLPAAGKEAMQTYQHNLEKIAGVRNLALLPVTQKTSQPLYAAALENILKIEMDATGISDADLKQSIETQLQQQGINDVVINVNRDANGLRMITTKLPQTPGKDYGFDLTLKDGNQHTRIKEQVKFKPDRVLPNFKTMTDEEIKAFIIKDHPDIPLSPEDINLTREGEDILISVDKEGNNLKLRVK
jgi:hypothetical protein